MNQLRQILRRHSRLALLVLAMALVVKATIPVGYMIGAGADRELTIQICGGQAGQSMTLVVPGKPDSAGHDAAFQATHCPFAGNGAPALAAADPVLLAAALLFVLLLGFAPWRAPELVRHAYRQPPPRGPPALI